MKILALLGYKYFEAILDCIHCCLLEVNWLLGEYATYLDTFYHGLKACLVVNNFKNLILVVFSNGIVFFNFIFEHGWWKTINKS